MPKQKTHRGAAKRFKVTSKGKVKRWKAGRRHLLECKTTKQLRNLRKLPICYIEGQIGGQIEGRRNRLKDVGTD